MTAIPTAIAAVASANLGGDRPQAAPVLEKTAPVVSAKTWLAVLGATLGAFMAVLNIQIVNASLADIQGAIGAGIDDGGWLAQVFSIRIYLLTNAVLFLVFSAACAFAQDLPQMITLLPKATQPVGLALFAISATFAPAIGPTI